MDRAEFRNLLCEVRDRTFWPTVHRPDELNTLNRETMAELGEAVRTGSSARRNRSWRR